MLNEYVVFARRFNVAVADAHVLPTLFEVSAQKVGMPVRALLSQATYSNQKRISRQPCGHGRGARQGGCVMQAIQMGALLDWRTVTHSQSDKFMVRGTELSRAIVPGTLSRFQICEVRTYDRGETFPHGREYLIRDAATVTDEQVREGKRPAVVSRHPDELAALEWCAKIIENNC